MYPNITLFASVGTFLALGIALLNARSFQKMARVVPRHYSGMGKWTPITISIHM